MSLDAVTASISTQVDDGFVVYLNGEEVVRVGMPNGNIDFDTFANRNVNEAQVEGPFAMPSNLFVDGVNVFAVEVHQTALNSSDLVFGLELDASVEIAEGSSLPALDRSLRISE
ncbi:hypothetical protein ACFL2H_10850, partial [Planctomycetota bacterium]